MTTLQQRIAESFLAKLAESSILDSKMIEQLRSLFAEKKKLKPDDLVRVFSPDAGGDLK